METGVIQLYETDYGCNVVLSTWEMQNIDLAKKARVTVKYEISPKKNRINPIQSKICPCYFFDEHLMFAGQNPVYN